MGQSEGRRRMKVGTVSSYKYTAKLEAGRNSSGAISVWIKGENMG
jgi:hypothetical protein